MGYFKVEESILLAVVKYLKSRPYSELVDDAGRDPIKELLASPLCEDEDK